eukprot:220007_1
MATNDTKRDGSRVRIGRPSKRTTKHIFAATNEQYDYEQYLRYLLEFVSMTIRNHDIWKRHSVVYSLADGFPCVDTLKEYQTTIQNVLAYDKNTSFERLQTAIMTMHMVFPVKYKELVCESRDDSFRQIFNKYFKDQNVFDVPCLLANEKTFNTMLKNKQQSISKKRPIIVLSDDEDLQIEQEPQNMCETSTSVVKATEFPETQQVEPVVPITKQNDERIVSATYKTVNKNLDPIPTSTKRMQRFKPPELAVINKKPQNEWRCDICTLDNQGNSDVCAICRHPKTVAPSTHNSHTNAHEPINDGIGRKRNDYESRDMCNHREPMKKKRKLTSDDGAVEVNKANEDRNTINDNDEITLNGLSQETIDKMQQVHNNVMGNPVSSTYQMHSNSTSISDALSKVQQKYENIMIENKMLKKKNTELQHTLNAVTIQKNQLSIISASLREQLLKGHEPRRQFINSAKSKDGIERTRTVQQWKDELNEVFKNTVISEHEQPITSAMRINIQTFLELNGDDKEYTNPTSTFNKIKLNNMVEQFTIQAPHRVPQLIGQEGVRCTVDAIPKGVVLARYVGFEMTNSQWNDTFDYSNKDGIHGQYLYSFNVDLFEHEDGEERCVTIDPIEGHKEFIGIYINDGRKDIYCEELSASDKKHINCTFFVARIYGWPTVFLIATKQIIKGEELLLDYGKNFWYSIKQNNRWNGIIQKVRQLAQQNIIKNTSLCDTHNGVESHDLTL